MVTDKNEAITIPGSKATDWVASMAAVTFSDDYSTSTTHGAEHMHCGTRRANGNVQRAALIGTRNVMTESFYRQRLIVHGVDLATPDMKNVDIVERIIYEELMVGKKVRDSERELRTIITKKQQEGLEAIVLACTELDLIVDVDANVLPIFDSTRIHCKAAADWILSEE